MATYYAYYICNSPSTIPHFYSNSAPSFPGEFLTFTGGVDPDYQSNCYRVEIITKDPPSVILIDWSDPGTTYFTFDSCADCELGEVTQILENCSDPLDIICLQNYLVVGAFVVYNNKCYEVKEVPSCNATVPITFSPTAIFKTCLSCNDSIPPINYKLIDCETGQETYTSTDLSSYVGQVIKIDGADNCYQVEIVQDIPFGTDVVVTESFSSCELCNSDFYLLTPCEPNGDLEPIVTYTDLSDYVGGIIRLETCPEICWGVSATEANTNPAEVTVIDNYETCNECIIDVLPPICVTFTNTYNSTVGFAYIDQYGDVQKNNLNAKVTTPKTCALWWDVIEGITVTKYGNCIDGACPPPIQPKRRVTPGYNTPVCSTEYYEKVECTFSELMYKDVLTERYGISNCCPEEEMKWVIKHEMLMLDILVNPDYNCTPVSTCDCPAIGGVTMVTVCPDVTRYIVQRCDFPEVDEVVIIDNQYDVLGNVILIDDICYTVVEATNRLSTVYWTPGTIYTTCQDCEYSLP